MPVTQATLRELLRLRHTVDTHVDGATGDMVRAWGRLWNEMAHDWALAVDQVIATGTTGRLTRAQLYRLARVRAALTTTSEALRHLAGEAESIIVAAIPGLVADTTDAEVRVIVSQLPDALFRVGSLDTPGGRTLAAITRRATEQVTSLTRPLAGDAYQAMLAELQRGVALGVNPKVAARRMLQRTRGEFDGGLARATRIARTEMLDAHRAAAQATDATNTDVLAGWRWSTSLSPRTCPACLAMNGRVFPTTAPGPHGHVNCRCARSPVTKSWADLGIAIPEPADTFPDARAWFDGLTTAEQLAIMGPTRLRLLQSGAVSWDDLAVEVPNPGWRPSWQPRNLTDLRSLTSATA